MKTKVRSRRSVGFRVQPLYRRRHMSLARYLSRKFAFWTAMFSLLAFVVGSQAGEHGWYAFVHAVMGDVDDSLIAYDGTVEPLRVPDYSKQKSGQNFRAMTYDQIPTGVYQSLPHYDAAAINRGEYAWVYSVGFMGSYATGGDGDGSHPAVDISAPKGTPVVSSMKGLVIHATYDAGFGNYVTIKTALAPDPYHPGQTTHLYATYGHLSETEVHEGQIVEKGQKIGEVGATGDATGNHLHFQIDRDAVIDGKQLTNFPVWPFTSMDARSAGLSYMQAIDSGLHQDRGYAESISPLIYVQMNPAPIATAVAKNTPVSSSSAGAIAQKKNMHQLAAERRQARLAKNAATVVAGPSVSPPTLVVYNDEESAPPAVSPPVSSSSSPSAPSSVSAVPTNAGACTTIDLEWDHAASQRREWKSIDLVCKDGGGNTVSSPSLKADLYLRTAFGDAQFNPPIVTSLDFVQGHAHVKVLAFSPTVVLMIQPLGITFTNDPMKFTAK